MTVLIEGFTADQILAWPSGDIAALMFRDEPIAFRAGSAQILGQFRTREDAVVVELAQVDGGGEGVLPTLWMLAEHCAEQSNKREVEWIVHAVACEKPNLKLRRVLERKGFRVETLPQIGRVYHYVHTVAPRT